MTNSHSTYIAASLSTKFYDEFPNLPGDRPFIGINNQQTQHKLWLTTIGIG
ncbi:MAG: hypothetical protein ACRC6M_14580 [Microcystaceae cyanobacterium]